MLGALAALGAALLMAQPATRPDGAVGGGPGVGESTPRWLSEADLTGRIAIVTGPTSGLGEETALQLAARGARVVLACRNVTKGEVLAARIAERGQQPSTVIQLDLADPPSVGRFVSAFDAQFEALDILVNNGGVSTVLRDGRPSVKGGSADGSGGVEETFLVNHLSHFALTLALLPAFGRRGPGAPAGRIVHVASRAHRRMPPPPAKALSDGLDGLSALPAYGWLDASASRAWLNSADHLSTPSQLMERYALSKLAQLSFALHLDRLLHSAPGGLDGAHASLLAPLNGRRVVSNAVHPGIVRTGILTETYNAVGPIAAAGLGLLVRLRALFVGLEVPAGALPQLWCAAATALDERGVHGAYAVPAPLEEGGVALRPPEHVLATNEAFGARVWQLSEKLWRELLEAEEG